MDRMKIYDILFWLSLASILLWVILKALGYINTPVLIEQYPIIGAIFGAGIFYQKMNEMERRLGRVERTTNHIDKRVSALEIKDNIFS